MFSCSILDVSFNKIKKLENLNSLVNLVKLFVIHNKISTMTNFSHLNKLTMLELGDNRITVSSCIVLYFIDMIDLN